MCNIQSALIYGGKGRNNLPSGDIATACGFVNSPLFRLQQNQPIPDQLPTNYPNQQYSNNTACNSKSVKYNFFCALIYGGKGRKDLPSGDIATPCRFVNSPLF